MSCFILPTTPFLKLAFLPRVLIGYPQGYPPTPAAPPPPPALTATAPPRIIRQPLPPTTVVATPVANGTFHAAAPPAMDSLPLATTTGTRPASFHLGAKTVPYRTQNSLPKANHRYQRNGNSLGKGLKRKADELCGSPSPNSSTESSTADGEGKADSTISYDLLQPLYCKVCRVTLNAPAQAKQHYEGKNHSKKMRLYEDSDIDKDKNGSLESNGSLGDQVSSQTDGTKTTFTEINPEVYCRTCGVSFNSPKQAHQHYQGKNHAKKTRASQQQEKQQAQVEGKYRSKFNCDICNIHVTSQEQLDSHIKGARHAARGRLPDTTVVPPIRHRWKHTAIRQIRSDKYLYHTLPTAFCQSF